MAGEYVRWLARNEKPREKRELTPEEQRRNWWHYNRGYVLGALILAVMLLSVISDTLETRRNAPDCTVAYVGTQPLAPETAAGLEAVFSALCPDVTGNGETLAQLRQYQLFPEGTDDPALAQQDYANTMALMSDLDVVGSMIFILEDPEAFQTKTGILARIDGTIPEKTPDSDLPLWIPCAEIPALDGLGVDGLYIALRGLWNGEDTAATRGGLALWGNLTS